MTPDFAEAELRVDLAALVENWRSIRARVGAAEASAVVKADAYGLGLSEVAPALWRGGCRTFCVAHPAEALALRKLLPDARIFALHGAPGEAAAAFAASGIIPVLNSRPEIERVAAYGRAIGGMTVGLQIDTGMSRLGLPPADYIELTGRPGGLDGLRIELVMSHLACGDEPDHPMTARQLADFNRLRGLLPQARASLANSAACFLGADFHFDLVRPGIALYGGRALASGPNPMREVVQIIGKIIQCRRIDTPASVGYGATHSMPAGGRVATVAVGYADGYPRSLSNRGIAIVRGQRVPVVGRVSMDLITLDVSALPADLAIGEPVNLLGGGVPADALAAEAGTIDYELLTRLGRRFRRTYVNAPA